jgi:hypothetical protein
MARVRSPRTPVRRFLLIPTAIIAAIVALLPLTTANALGQSGHIITFDAPGAGTSDYHGTFPYGMNSDGTVAGWVTNLDGTAGFIRSTDGKMSIIQVPGADVTEVFSINDSGTIAGLDFKGLHTEGFLRTPDGRLTSYFPDGAQFLLSPNRIDNLGNVAGTFTNYYGGGCYLRAADGTITDFHPPSAFACEVNDIVDGTISGTNGDPIESPGNAFLRNPDGTFTIFQVGYQTGLAAINSEGVAAGYFVWLDSEQGHWQGYVREANGVITHFDMPGAFSITPTDINSSGTVTGNYTSWDLAYHGFERLPDGTIETFDVPGAGTGIYQGTVPNKINAAGSITGLFIDSNNVYHGFLLTPQLER